MPFQFIFDALDEIRLLFRSRSHRLFTDSNVGGRRVCKPRATFFALKHFLPYCESQKSRK